MMVSVSADVMNSPARVGLVKDILEITEHFSEKHDLQMHYSGLPYIRVVNAENIKGEMYMFIILSLLITTFILYLFFRSFRIIGFCLLIVLICVSWTVGVMAMLRYQDHFTHRHATASVDRNMYSELGIHDQQVSCGIRPSRE